MLIITFTTAMQAFGDQGLRQISFTLVRVATAQLLARGLFSARTSDGINTYVDVYQYSYIT